MSTRPQLPEAFDPAELTRLRREIVGLEAELESAQDQAKQAKQASADAIAAIRALRKITEPLYTALRMIHGEISRVDAAALGDEERPARANGKDPRWDSWKSKLGGLQAEMIDVLLEHGEMTTAQIAVALRRDPRTITKGPVYQLNKAQLLRKNGGKFSLVEL